MNGISSSMKISAFRVSEVSFSGHVLSADGVKRDPLKVEAVNAMSSLSDRKEL